MMALGHPNWIIISFPLIRLMHAGHYCYFIIQYSYKADEIIAHFCIHKNKFKTR